MSNLFVSVTFLNFFKKGIKNKNSQKYEYFEHLITQDYSGKEQQSYLNDLQNCNLMFHSLHNFALMPQTGGMNNFKGTGAYMNDKGHNLDRLDKFIFFLSQYYDNPCIDNPIFSRAQGKKSKKFTAEQNTTFLKILLKQFLDYIGSVYQYCEYFYLIKDIDFINCLIDSGGKTIDSGKSVVAYMKLAEDFWAIRHEISKSDIN